MMNTIIKTLLVTVIGVMAAGQADAGEIKSCAEIKATYGYDRCVELKAVGGAIQPPKVDYHYCYYSDCCGKFEEVECINKKANECTKKACPAGDQKCADLCKEFVQATGDCDRFENEEIANACKADEMKFYGKGDYFDECYDKCASGDPSMSKNTHYADVPVGSMQISVTIKSPMTFDQISEVMNYSGECEHGFGSFWDITANGIADTYGFMSDLFIGVDDMSGNEDNGIHYSKIIKLPTHGTIYNFGIYQLQVPGDDLTDIFSMEVSLVEPRLNPNCSVNGTASCCDATKKHCLSGTECPIFLFPEKIVLKREESNYSIEQKWPDDAKLFKASDLVKPYKIPAKKPRKTTEFYDIPASKN